MPLSSVDTEGVRSGSVVKSETRWSAIGDDIWSGPSRVLGRAFFANSEFVLRWWCLCLNERNGLARTCNWGQNRTERVCDPCREHENGESYYGVCFLFSTHAVMLHARSNQKTRRCDRSLSFKLNPVAVGRKLDRIHNYEANCWKKTIGNSRRADRRGDHVRCELPLRRAL